MNEQDILTAVKDFLGVSGSPVVGISPASRLPSVPVDFSPQHILHPARSVICYGLPIPRGILHAENHSLALYWRYCNMVYRALDTCANRLCLFLEEQGLVASPIYGCFPWKVVGREFWGLLPLVYWAEQAGLGRLAKCGLLAHPKHGTRLLLGGLITSLELEATGELAEVPCPPACTECVDACPVEAIGSTGKVNHNACLRYSGANPLLVHLLEDRAVKEKFSFETCLNTVGVDDHGSYTCNQCLKVCPLNH